MRRQFYSPTFDKWSEFVTNNNMGIVARPLYSQVIPLWFRFVFQIENETEETFWDNDVQRESQAVLDSIKEHDFHGALKRGENNSLYTHTFQRRQFWWRFNKKIE
jgi:hypothetical protein